MYAGGYDYSGGPASAGYAASGPPVAPYSTAPHAAASYGSGAAAPVAYSAPGGYGAAGNRHMVSRSMTQASQVQTSCEAVRRLSCTSQGTLTATVCGSRTSKMGPASVLTTSSLRCSH